MTDDREFVPGQVQGLWVSNPHFTGHRLKLFERYPVKVLCPLHGIKRYMKSNHMVVSRLPSGQLYLEELYNGVVFTDAIEGTHFDLLSTEPVKL